MKKKILLFSILCCCCLNLSLAQQKNSKNDSKKIESKQKKSKNLKVKNDTLENKNSVSFTVGFGLGAVYTRKLSNKFYATAGYNGFLFSLRDLEQEISGETLLIDTDLDYRSLDFKIHYHPFGTSFRLVGGFGYFTSSNIHLETTFKNNIKVGDVQFTTADSGNLIIDIDWSEFAPYVGLGFGKLVKSKMFSLAIDFGTYLSDSPVVTLDATGIIEQTKSQEQLLNDTFESFKFIPFGNIKLIYSF